MYRQAERGGTRLKLLFWLLVLGLLVYAAVKNLPAFITNYELEDYMRTEARFAAAQRKSPEEVRDNVYNKVLDLGVPVSREDIRVVANPRGVSISLQYTVVVDLLLYSFDWTFQPQADSRAL